MGVVTRNRFGSKLMLNPPLCLSPFLPHWFISVKYTQQTNIHTHKQMVRYKSEKKKEKLGLQTCPKSISSYVQFVVRSCVRIFPFRFDFFLSLISACPFFIFRLLRFFVVLIVFDVNNSIGAAKKTAVFSPNRLFDADFISISIVLNFQNRLASSLYSHRIRLSYVSFGTVCATVTLIFIIFLVPLLGLLLLLLFYVWSNESASACTSKTMTIPYAFYRMKAVSGSEWAMWVCMRDCVIVNVSMHIENLINIHWMYLVFL